MEPSQFAMATTRGIREVTIFDDQKVELEDDSDFEVKDVIIH
jgi:hypothetical protein